MCKVARSFTTSSSHDTFSSILSKEDEEFDLTLVNCCFSNVVLVSIGLGVIDRVRIFFVLLPCNIGGSCEISFSCLAKHSVQ